jgi:hypothetical protein
MRTVEIDFDVHKRIELERTSFAESPNRSSADCSASQLGRLPSPSRQHFPRRAGPAKA